MRKRALIMIVLLSVTILVFIGIILAGLALNLPATPVIILAVLSLVPIIVFSVLPFLTPGWIPAVRQNGTRADAVVLENKVMEGVGYKGSDMWVELPVEVQPVDAAPFQADMKIKLSQTVFGLLQSGSRVTVAYDPAALQRVVIAEDGVQLGGRRMDV